MKTDWELIFYTRKGCCLCESLEKKIKSLAFIELNPSIDLKIVDIDGEETSTIEKNKYDLKVPVMLLRSSGLKRMVELPRVSPRLNGKGLYSWFQKTITKEIG